MMKKCLLIISAFLFASAALFTSCDYPIDKDGILKTDKDLTGMTNFDLLDESHRTVKVGNPAIDTAAGTVEITVFYGANLKKLIPTCSVDNDCTVRPNMGFLTDFSDTANPKKYTVISGNQERRKEYTIYITVQSPN